MKRFFDISASLIGLFIFLPIFIIIPILIKRESSGPAIFCHTRVGRNFKLFDLYKFRSMIQDAPMKGLPITADGDPRITKIGRFLRRTKIDELPGLLNVLKGDMSIVGPRPEVIKFVDMFRDDYNEILRLRPGITDYAAIEYLDEELVLKRYSDPEDAYIKEILPAKIRLYKKYLKEQSMLVDIKLILLTLKKMVR